MPGYLANTGRQPVGLRLGHRIARRAAEHDDVAFAAQRLDQPFGGLLADLALAFGGAVEIILADNAGEFVAGVVRHDRHAGAGRFARRLQNGRTAVEKRDNHVVLLRDQTLDVGDVLLRLELTVSVASFGDVLALRRLVFEFGASDVAPVIAAPSIGQRDLDRLGTAELGHRLQVGNRALLVRIEFNFGHIDGVADRGHGNDQAECRNANRKSAW